MTDADAITTDPLADASTTHDVRLLTVDVTNRDGAAIVAVRGAITAITAAHLEAELTSVIREGAAVVAVDLSEITRAGHWLFTVLSRIHTALKSRGGHLYLIAGDDTMLSLINLSGFDRITPVLLTRAYRDRIRRQSVAPLTPRLNKREYIIDLHENRRAHKYPV